MAMTSVAVGPPNGAVPKARGLVVAELEFFTAVTSDK
jgi:hypothetical protein